MIDVHTHLDSLPDPDGAVERALDAGVQRLVTIGAGPDSARAALDIAGRWQPHVRVVVGVHPQSAAAFDMGTWDEVAAMARHELVCGIGETGLDQYRDYGTVDQQLPLFEAQAALATELRLPLVIHTRAAEDATLAALNRFADDCTVVLHCFSLSEHVDQVLAQDWILSFAGNVTYPSASDLRTAARQVPSDRLLVETDAPYLTPVPHRGTPNEPARIVHTYDVVAAERGVTREALAADVLATAARVFGSWVETPVPAG